jgi:hypothetical protein
LVEAVPTWRRDWSRIVKAALSPLSANSCLQLIDTVIERVNHIAEGSFGRVDLGHLRSKIEPFPIAVKSISLDGYSGAMLYATTKQFYKEARAMEFANSLVALNICPHYALLYEPFLCQHSAQPSSIVLVQEFCTNTLRVWLTRTRSLKELLLMSFQVLLGLVSMHAVADISHNDIHSNNIMFNDVPSNTVYSYTVSGKTFYFDLGGAAFRIGDWGHATGEPLDFSHDIIDVDDIDNVRKFERYEDIQAAQASTIGVGGKVLHPHMFRYSHEDPQNKGVLPPFVRDIVMFFYILMGYAGVNQPHVPVAWATMAIQLAKSSKFYSYQTDRYGRLEFFKALFDVESMPKEFQSRLDPDFKRALTSIIPSVPPQSISVVGKFDVRMTMSTSDVVSTTVNNTLPALTSILVPKIESTKRSNINVSK